MVCGSEVCCCRHGNGDEFIQIRRSAPPVKVIGIRSESISEGFDLAEGIVLPAARPSASFFDYCFNLWAPS